MSSLPIPGQVEGVRPVQFGSIRGSESERLPDLRMPSRPAAAAAAAAEVDEVCEEGPTQAQLSGLPTIAWRLRGLGLTGRRIRRSDGDRNPSCIPINCLCGRKHVQREAGRRRGAIALLRQAHPQLDIHFGATP